MTFARADRLGALGLAAALAAGPMALMPAAAGAQTAPPPQAQTEGGQTEGAAPVADAQVRAFAAAAMELRDIAMQTERELRAVEDAQAREVLQREATEQMVEAVQQSGLSVQSYNDIAQRAQEDVQLARRITDEIETMQAN